jgi:group I intron endonuclease
MNNYLLLEELLTINNSHYSGENNFVSINGEEYSFIKGYLYSLPYSYSHQQYSIRRNKSATYILQEFNNGKVYVGSSGEIYKRITKHKYLIERKMHENFNFNNLLKETDIKNFELIIIFTNSREDAYDLEQLLINYYIASGRLINIATNVRLARLGTTLTDEHKRKIAEANANRIVAEESKQLMSDFHKTDEKAIAQFKEILDSKKRRLSVYGVEYESLTEAGNLAKVSESFIRRNIDRNHPYIYWLTDNASPLKGRFISDKQRQTLSTLRKSDPKLIQQFKDAAELTKKKILLNGILYNSILEAVENTGISEPTIHRYADKTSDAEHYILNYETPKPFKVSVNGMVYENRSMAAKELGISISTLKGRIKSKHNSNYFYTK